MNANRLLLAAAASVVVLGGGWAAGPKRGAAALQAGNAGRVRLVFVSDTSAANGAVYRLNAALMSKVFEDANERDPRHPYDAPVLVQGDRVRAADILRVVAQVPVRAGVDTVAVFYWGHGTNDAARDHFFALTCGESVPRQKVVDAAETRRPRLTVVLSDTCSNVYTSPTARAMAAPQGPVDWKALRALLLEHRGVCDVNACKPGQYSWNVAAGPERQSVSLFTRALIDQLYTSVPEGSASTPAPVDWPLLLRQVGGEANRLFAEYDVANAPFALKIGQKSQDPFAYSLPVPLTRTAKEPDGEATVAGTYHCVGENIDGTTYAGTVTISRRGEAYLLQWTLERSTHTGVGLLRHGVLSCGWAVTSGGQNIQGVVIYEVERDHLVGKWTQHPGTGTVFRETLTRKEGP